MIWNCESNNNKFTLRGVFVASEICLVSFVIIYLHALTLKILLNLGFIIQEGLNLRYGQLRPTHILLFFHHIISIIVMNQQFHLSISCRSLHPLIQIWFGSNGKLHQHTTQCIVLCFCTNKLPTCIKSLLHFIA